MYKLKNVVWITFFSIFLLINGCGDSSHSTEQEPSINEDSVILNEQEVVKLDQDKFSDGVITDNVKIVIQNGEEVLTEAIIPAETELYDENGEPTNADSVIISVAQKEAIETGIDEDNSTKDVVQSIISIADENNNTLIPSQEIEMKIKAPLGAKEGDTVKVYIPDEAEATVNKSIYFQEKIAELPVGSNGYIYVRIPPEAFRKSKIVSIFIEVIKPINTPISIPTPTPVVTPTPTTEPVVTPTPSVTPEPTTTIEPTPSATPEPTTTIEPTPVPYYPPYIPPAPTTTFIPITGADGGN